MYDRIIVPIDDERADLETVLPLIRALGAEITLLHVHHAEEAPTELEGLPQYRFQGVVEAWDERDMEAEAHEVEWLAELAADVAASEPELRVTSRVVHAPLARNLRMGEESVLVVAPVNDLHLDGLSRTVLALLRGGGVPVLIHRPGTALVPIRRVVVTLDGSAFSQQVLDPALELARALNARVSLLEVVTRGGPIRTLLRPGDRSADAAETFLREVRGQIPETAGPVDVRVVEQGNPAAGIVAEGRREDVDLVAMATHGRTGLRRALLGSVAESVIRTASVPVLLYRPDSADVSGKAASAPVRERR